MNIQKQLPPGQWAGFYHDDLREYHVIPLGDEQDHLLHDCPCKPNRISQDEDGPLPRDVVVHSAFDSRELVEQAEVIKQQTEI